MVINKKVAKLKNVATIVGGSTPKTEVSEYWGGKHCWVAPAELDGRKYIASTIKTITDLAVQKTNLTLLPTGTVLLSSRAPIGKIAITTVPMYCNQGFKNIVCGPDLFNEYVYHFLNHNISYLQSLGTGATFKEISKKVVENVEISFPAYEEQKEIADELNVLSEIIELKSIQISDLDALAQSIFFEMFGDPVSNEKGWSRQAIGKLGRVITGSTPSTKDTRNYSSADYSFFKPGDIDKQSVSFLASADSYISSSAFANSRKLPAGSVLTTCIGIIGKVGILKKEATCNQQINAIIPEKVNSTYLAYVISFSKSIFESMANGPIVKIINKGDFSKVELPIPPMKLQKSFAEKIQEIQLQKERIEASKRDVEDLLSNRMTYYFD